MAVKWLKCFVQSFQAGNIGAALPKPMTLLLSAIALKNYHPEILSEQLNVPAKKN